ncbi:ribosomal protein S18 [Peziza echinospora]|nr:ribosomal protein S18 [Peziza echinospora]
MPPRIPTPTPRLLRGLFGLPTSPPTLLPARRFLSSTPSLPQQNSDDPPRARPAVWSGPGTTSSINLALKQTVSDYTHGLGFTPSTTPSAPPPPKHQQARHARNADGSTLGGAPAPGSESPGADLETEELFRLQRRFAQGDMYTPKDLSYESFKAFRRRKPPKADSFDLLGIDPLREYKNFNLLGEFVTEMGRIKHRTETGLRGVNQRKIAKAIRRAVGIGLLPSTHKHPELLKKMEQTFYMRQKQAKATGRF